MIQDDPINKLKGKAQAQGYFPLKLDSEEEICLKEIDISLLKETKVNANNSNNHNNVYYKYALLIGLCKMIMKINYVDYY